MAETAFSEDGKYFSLISQDGRLKIWDTETNVLKQEFTPDLHLSSPPSCLQWIVVSNTHYTKRNKKRSNSISEDEKQYVALGTKNGKILLYSVAQAKVETVLFDKQIQDQNHSVTSLDWHHKYGLYSCSRNNNVFEWDINSASIKNKYNINIENKIKSSSISIIKIIPHNLKTTSKFLISCSYQVRVWSLHDGTASVVRLLGHNTASRPLVNLAVLGQKCWLIEGSQNERLLNFWDVTVSQDHLTQINGDDTVPTKKQRKKSLTDSNIPSYTFILEDAPRFTDVSVNNIDGGVKVDIGAVTRTGVVHYYGHMLNGTSTKPIKPSVTIQVTSSNAVPLPAIACNFRLDDMRIGYEITAGRLVFENIQPDTKSKTQVLIRDDSSTKAKRKVTEKTNNINKTKSAEGDVVTYVEPLGGVAGNAGGKKRATPGGKIEVPMEARLANLALDTKNRSKSAVSQNLTKLLVQGLHSKDNSIIQTVLQRDDESTAVRTVSNLPAEYVPPLLDTLTDMAANKTTQCSSVCTWVSALVRCQSALLLATLAANSPQLTHLSAIFTQRRSHLCQLLNLRGRIELTMSQRTSDVLASQDNDAVIEYDDSSSESSMEANLSSDNESWDEEKFDTDQESNPESE